MVTAAQFRTDFPEFSSTTVYPDGQVNFWLGIAGKLLNAPLWDNMLDAGTELFIAHQLALAAQSQKTAAGGGVPGATTGAVTAKSVDKVSVNYDSSAVMELNAGHWNLTTYGLRFIQLARMFGAGGALVSGNNGGAPIAFFPWSPSIVM